MVQAIVSKDNFSLWAQQNFTRSKPQMSFPETACHLLEETAWSFWNSLLSGAAASVPCTCCGEWGRCVWCCCPLHTLISHALTLTSLSIPSLDRREAEQWLFSAQQFLGVHLPLSFRAVSPPSYHKNELWVKQGSSKPIHWHLAKNSTWEGVMTLFSKPLLGNTFLIFGWMFCCFCLAWLRVAYKVWT